jgi:hypothetical protein
MEMYTEAHQVPMQSADIQSMEHDYQRMDAAERASHHDALVKQGYEWCPDCGAVLVWDLPSRRAHDRQRDVTPVVCGDIPPLTAEDLHPAAPAAH